MSTIKVTRFASGAAAATLSVVLLAACASSHTAATTGSTANAGAGGASGLLTETTSIGTVAANASGHTLYELVGDSASAPKCTGGCLAIWPAEMSGGTQVVLQGHPAYTFSADTAAGQTKGQDVTDKWGTWYALDSNGKPIMSEAVVGGASSPASSSASSSGSGGYGY